MTTPTEALAQFLADAATFRAIVRGPASGPSSTVATDNGPVDTVAKALAIILGYGASGVTAGTYAIGGYSITVNAQGYITALTAPSTPLIYRELTIAADGTWTVPATFISTTQLIIEALGAGAGAGGANAASRAGGGGGSGAWMESAFHGFTAGQNITFDIGAFGAGGSSGGGNGVDGAATTATYNSVLFLSAGGGVAGVGASTNASALGGGVNACTSAIGASGLTQDFTTLTSGVGAGEAGGNGIYAQAISGRGGNSRYGRGGVSLFTGGAGSAGAGYGAGGGGALSSGAGGNGTPGLIRLRGFW